MIYFSLSVFGRSLDFMHRRIPKFTVFILIIQALLVYLHWFIYYTLIIFLRVENRSAILWLEIIFTGLSLSFIIASVLAFRYASAAVGKFYAAAAVWMGFFSYFLTASLFSWIWFAFQPATVRGAVILSFAAAALVAFWGIVNADIIRITDVTLRLKNLPAAWKTRTAVFVSDFHLGYIRKDGFARRVARSVNRLKPDIVFIGGDVYDGMAADIRKMTAPLAAIKPPLGVWFVSGNHDEFRDGRRYLEELKKVGIRALNNELASIDGLQVIGVDYSSTEIKEDYVRVMEGIVVDHGRPSILLRHVPNFTSVAKRAGISIQFSGHTHNAQIFPLMFLARWIFRGRHYGLRRKWGFLSYTSSGVGTWGPPLRVGTKSEIVNIYFEDAAEKKSWFSWR